MEDQNYTIKDIARMAGVSAGTVDRVLHNRGDVSPKSKAKVQKVLDEIHYQPNVFAIGLAAKKKYTFIQNKEEKEKPWSIDTKIRFIAFWIKKNSCPKAHTIKGDVKISVLRNVLTNKGVKLVQKGCHIEVFTEKENKFLGIFPRKTTLMKKTYTLGNNRTCINRETLNALRKDFNLTLSDGIDDTFFYDDDAFLDSEIKTYKKIIYQLSKT